MTAIICDVTKKVIPGARKDVNYVVLMGKNLSLDAKSDLDATVRAAMKKEALYSFRKYKKTYMETLLKMCK